MIATGFMSLFGTYSLNGEILTVNFTGTVSSVSDVGGFFPGVMIGDQVTGTYSYDTDSDDQLVDIQHGRYETPVPPGNLVIIVGPLSFQVASPLSVAVTNGTGGASDTLQIVGPSPGLAPSGGLSLLFQDPTGTAFSDDTIPQASPDLAQFTLSFGTLVVQADFSSVNFDFISVGGDTPTIPAVSGWTLVAMLLLIVVAGPLLIQRRRLQENVA
ncbi:MAG: hypothetical protein IID42_04540 [Planctomycetes bacterium]|nr:hypothetical protein [Planctomycetota bacterium]